MWPSRLPTSSGARSPATQAAAAMAAGLRTRGFRRGRRSCRWPTAGRARSTRCSRRAADRAARSMSPGRSGDPVDAEYGVLPDGTAIVEMARASGLALVAGRNDPLRASDARDRRADRGRDPRWRVKRVIVGVGGSATTDGGLAAVEALGWSLGGVEVTVACDVDDRLRRRRARLRPAEGRERRRRSRCSTRRLERLADQYRSADRCRRARARGCRRGGRTRRRPRGDRRAARAGFEVVARRGRSRRGDARASTSSSPARASSTRRASRARSSAACSSGRRRRACRTSASSPAR